MTDTDWLRLNRENWEDRVRVHQASDFYDLPGFRAGACTLRPFELDELGDVAGRRLLHLQCHMGQDPLDRRTAPVHKQPHTFAQPLRGIRRSPCAITSHGVDFVP